MTYIYHITHVNNLPLILSSGGLIAKNRLRQQQIKHLDIAYENIQDRRSRTPVPCGAGGVLHDYVPFYFAPRSPMLCAIHNGRVPGYSQGQNPVIHLVAEAEALEAENIAFAFTDGHAVISYIEFYDDLAALELVIDWDLMKSRYWFDNPEDPNRKCRRQAEFLAHQFCPWRLITKIGVRDSIIKSQVEKTLDNLKYKPTIEVYADWYY